MFISKTFKQFFSRYLAGGAAFERYSASVYRISRSSASKIIMDTCKIIYEELAKTEFPKYTKEFWLNTAIEYHTQWNMPHCLGSIDGKHVRIKKPANAGSMYYNYKGFHSIILMAISDANYRFTFIDVGSPGADGDMNTFSRTSIGQKIFINDESLNLPEDEILDDFDCPYFFVGDDAFPLHLKVMKPYSGRSFEKNQETGEKSRKNLELDKTIFNYRLSRARRTVENAFGILTMRWGCLRSEFQCKPEKVRVIVAASCALHNYMMKEGKNYLTSTMIDTFIADDQSIDGEWRSHEQLTPMDSQKVPKRPKDDAILLRDQLKRYVNVIDKIPNQEKYATNM